MNINSTFYIRGDGFDENNYTLKFIKNNGVELIFMSRQDFKQIRERTFLDQLSLSNPDAYIIPEGASNKLATYGSSEIYDEICSQLGYVPDYILMDMGTGGTIAGVLMKITQKTKLIGIPVVKGVNWNETLISIIGRQVSDVDYQIIEDYHFGGFGKFNPALIEFINSYKYKFGIDLDPIYTGKLVFGLHDLMKKDFFRKGSTIVWVHGGGTQGIKGFNKINNDIIF
jgi:1-aminocyclopropane-1-carboxylate deaminase